MRSFAVVLFALSLFAVVFAGVKFDDKLSKAWSCIDADKFGAMTLFNDPLVHASIDDSGNPEWVEFSATTSYTLLKGLHKKELVRFSAPVFVGARSEGYPLSCVSDSAYPLKKPSAFYFGHSNSPYSDVDYDWRIYYYPVEVGSPVLLAEATAALALINDKLGTQYKINAITAAGIREDSYNNYDGLIRRRTRFAVTLSGGAVPSAVFESRHEAVYQSNPYAQCDKLVVGPGTLLPVHVPATTAHDPALEDVSPDAYKYTITNTTCH